MKFYKVMAITGLCLCCAGARATVEALFNAIQNANINGINANKKFINERVEQITPIATAISTLNPDVVSAVISAGADLTQKTKHYTPLIQAISSSVLATQENSEKIINTILAQKNIAINETDIDGDTAMLIVFFKISITEKFRLALFTKIAGRDDAKLNTPTPRLNMTPLILAIENQYLDIINYLLEDKRDLGLAVQSKTTLDTALHRAFGLPTTDPAITDVNDPKKNPQIFALTKIIERMNPKDLNIKNAGNNTPLMLAQKKQLPKIGALLIAKGADFMVDGKDISETWKDQEIVEAVKRAREKTSRTTPLMELITKKDINGINKLLQDKKDDLKLGQQNIDGYTALMLAIKNRIDLGAGEGSLAEDLIPLMSRDELNLTTEQKTLIPKKSSTSEATTEPTAPTTPAVQKEAPTAITLAIEEKLLRVVNRLIEYGAKVTKSNLKAFGKKIGVDELTEIKEAIEKNAGKEASHGKEDILEIDKHIAELIERERSSPKETPGIDLTITSELKAINKFAKALYAIKKA